MISAKRLAFLYGSTRHIYFFASRLKYSRLICVSVVKDQTVESWVRHLAEHSTVEVAPGEAEDIHSLRVDRRQAMVPE